jgi:hypothetical protein
MHTEWKPALKEFGIRLVEKFTAVGIMIFVVMYAVSGVTPWAFVGMLLSSPSH